MKLLRHIVRWFIIAVLPFAPAVANAKCVLCVGSNCYVIDSLNCNSLVLAPSDVCRDVVRQIHVEHRSPTEAYAVIEQKRYRLASDEAQAKFDQMLKQNKGSYKKGEFERELAPIVARAGIVSQARINAIAAGGEVKDLKEQPAFPASSGSGFPMPPAPPAGKQ